MRSRARHPSPAIGQGIARLLILPCLVSVFAGCLYAAAAESDQERKRLREIGIVIGQYQPGPLNAITDVAGVKIGQATLIRGEGPLKPGQGPVRTGVTVIIPRDDVVPESP